MFLDISTTDKLYWMVRSNGEQQIGFLLTKEDLLESLPRMYISGRKEGVSTYRMRDYNFRKPNDLDIEHMLNNKGREFSGSYGEGDIFTVTEVTKKAQIKELITWANYKIDQGFGTEPLVEPYPEYVSNKYKLDNCVNRQECFTSRYLPDSEEKNTLIEKYIKSFGLKPYQLRFRYSKDQDIAIDIAQALQDGYLTPKVYKDIIVSSVLSRDDMAALEMYENYESGAKSVEVAEGYETVSASFLVPKESYDAFEETLGEVLQEVLDKHPDVIETGVDVIDGDFYEEDIENDLEQEEDTDMEI